MRYATFFFTILITALIAACVIPGSAPAASLKGEWTLSAMNGKAPIPGTTITVTFDNGAVGGRSGCNSYGGRFSTSGEKLTTSELMMTQMACMDPQGIMEQESAYLQALGQAASFSSAEGKLEIHNASGDTILVFTHN